MQTTQDPNTFKNIRSPKGTFPIHSPQNEKYKVWTSLLESKGIREHQMFLVFGQKIIADVLLKHPQFCLHLILPEGTEDKLLPLPQTTQLDRYVLRKDLFEKLNLFGISFPILVCELPEMPTADLSQNPQGLQLLLPFQDPGNMGAVIRSALAFSIEEVVILKGAAHPFHPKSIRAATYPPFDLNIQAGPTLQELNPQTHLWVMDGQGESLTDFAWPKNLSLLIGEEGRGVPQALKAQRVVSIPMSENIESLNAAVSSSIALFSYRQKRKNP